MESKILNGILEQVIIENPDNPQTPDLTIVPYLIDFQYNDERNFKIVLMADPLVFKYKLETKKEFFKVEDLNEDIFVLEYDMCLNAYEHKFTIAEEDKEYITNFINDYSERDKIFYGKMVARPVSINRDYMVVSKTEAEAIVNIQQKFLHDQCIRQEITIFENLDGKNIILEDNI